MIDRRHLAGAACAAAILLAGPCARAATFTVSAAGTIDSGLDTSGLFGAANGNLAGLGFSEVLAFDQPGSSSFNSPSDTTNTGTSTGRVTVTVGGVTFTAPFVESFSSYIEETPFELFSSNVGDNGSATESLSATVALQAAGPAFPVNLYRPFSYTARPADAGLNGGMVQFAVSDTGIDTSFSATPSSIALAVPEPGSLVLLAGAIGFAVRRRRA